MTAVDQVLAQQLQRLQLHSILQHYPALAEQAARESWTHGRFLEQLVAGEAARRDEALVRRRLKAARLPGIKTLDGFDWSWPKKINRAQIQQLFRLDFLPQHGNVVLLGGVGVGKTHLAIALAHTACLQGHTALFTSAVDIVNTLAHVTKLFSKLTALQYIGHVCHLSSTAKCCATKLCQSLRIFPQQRSHATQLVN
jgi:DNA replication protein DnaC